MAQPLQVAAQCSLLSWETSLKTHVGPMQTQMAQWTTDDLKWARWGLVGLSRWLMPLALPVSHFSCLGTNRVCW